MSFYQFLLIYTILYHKKLFTVEVLWNNVNTNYKSFIMHLLLEHELWFCYQSITMKHSYGFDGSNLIQVSLPMALDNGATFYMLV